VYLYNFFIILIILIGPWCSLGTSGWPISSRFGVLLARSPRRRMDFQWLYQLDTECS